MTFRRSLTAAGALILPVLLLAGLGGCASSASKLSMAPVRSQEAFTQSFSTAYASKTESGDFQVILVDDGLGNGQGDHGQPLQPTAAPPLRQVVQVRVFWRPMKGTKPNFPSASNAAIDWYVFGVGSRENADMIHYQGVGFVEVGGSREHPTVRIRSATLRSAERVGEIEDPIGAALVRGTIHAESDSGAVEHLQQTLRHSADSALARAGKQAIAGEASATAR